MMCLRFAAMSGQARHDGMYGTQRMDHRFIIADLLTLLFALNTKLLQHILRSRGAEIPARPDTPRSIGTTNMHDAARWLSKLEA